MFTNATPFRANAIPFQDERGVEVVVILAKATFLERARKLVLADEQTPIRMQDVPQDPAAVEAGRESSVRYPSDIGGAKRGADIVVVGNAFSRRPVNSMDVVVKAPGCEAALRVFGERVFYESFGIKIGPSAPFERSPITYERAYGGKSADGTVVDWRNPVGRGVFVSSSELEGAPAPCIEDPSSPIEAGEIGEPAGFGPIPMWWLPRRKYIGSLDADWIQERMPLPPLDFDARFNQVAPPGLQMDRPLRVGDTIATHGLHPDGLFSITVPKLSLVASLRRADGPRVVAPLVLDMALLEPEHLRVEFTLRLIAPLGRGSTLLEEVRLDVDA